MRCIAVFVCIAVALAPYAHSAAVLDVLASNPQFSIFSSYLETTGLDVGLSGNGPYSVFGQWFPFLWPQPSISSTVIPRSRLMSCFFGHFDTSF
jgi:hypothetical protein